MDQQPQSLRRRAACDRCHSQKLRCLKPSGSEICARCLKARVPCVYSPSLRGYRPAGDTATSTPSASSGNGNGNGFLDGSFAARISGTDDYPNPIEMEMDWNAPGAFDMLPDFGMVEGLNGFSLGGGDDGIGSAVTGQLNGIDHSPAESTANVSTIFGLRSDSASRDASIFSSSNSGNRGRFSSTPTETVEGSHSSKELSGDSSQLFLNGNKCPKPSHESSTKSASTDPRTAVLRELNDLSLQLYEHGNTIPSLPTSEEVEASLQAAGATSSENNSTTSTADGSQSSASARERESILDELQKGYEKSLDKQFAIDVTLKLSQTLIDLYPRFIDSILHCKPPLAADLPPNLRVSMPSRTSRSPSTMSSEYPKSTPKDCNTSSSVLQATNPSPPRLALDHASILLLLSAHLRLTEVYENMFTHSHICMHEALLPGRKPQVLASNVPVLKFGSYTPPSSSTVHMHLMLLEQLVEQLLECVEELMREYRKVVQRGDEMFIFVDRRGESVEAAEKDGEGLGERLKDGAAASPPKPPVDVTELTCLAVRDRASGLLDTVAYCRRLLIKYGWIRGTPS